MDYGVYVITDPRLSRGRSHREVIEAALRGGASVVQYREKNASTRRMIEEARELRDLCRANGVPFIVNDRVDVALAVDADGVHVGQEDMPASLARKLIGREKILGVSAENVEQAHAAVADGADYIGAGAIFSTATKADANKPIEIPGLLEIVRASTLPIVGIGGISATNATSVIRAGAMGIAVVSAIVSADDVERATRALRKIVDDAKRNL